MMDLAQLVRASVCDSESRGFESRFPSIIYDNTLFILLKASFNISSEVE